MRRYPCHQATQLPCGTNNSAIRSFSALTTCIANILGDSSQPLVPVLRDCCCIGTLCFSPLYLLLWICTCESVIIWGTGKKEREAAAGGAASSLSCGSVTWASTSGRKAGAPRLENAPYSFDEICREKLWRWFPSLLLSCLCISTMNFAFNASWPSWSATIKREAGAGRLLFRTADCCLPAELRLVQHRKS